MKFELGYGSGVQEVNVPDENVVGVLTPNEITHELTGAEEVERALAEPIASPRLRDIVKPRERIAIITSDITRPMPSSVVLPPVIEELYAAGVHPDDITIVFALGSHRHHTEEEKRKLVGSMVYDHIRCIDSDPDDIVCLGVTSWGTHVDITRVVARADRRICLGNIEFHYFAGYSGGAKAIMPGCSTPGAIQENHRMMADEGSKAGAIADNPVREDIEEAARIVGIDFIVNVVLDEHKRVVKAFAGDARKAHRAGCRFLDTMYACEIPYRADIVIVSQGGAPKDLNLYQTQKALDNAKHAIKRKGTVILIGSCKEGLGNAKFEEWMRDAKAPEDLIERVRTKYELGGHKAVAIAQVLKRADIFLVSEMDPQFVKDELFMIPFSSAQEAFDKAMEKYGPNASVLVMPYGGSTLPRME